MVSSRLVSIYFLRRPRELECELRLWLEFAAEVRPLVTTGIVTDGCLEMPTLISPSYTRFSFGTPDCLL